MGVHISKLKRRALLRFVLVAGALLSLLGVHWLAGTRLSGAAVLEGTQAVNKLNQKPVRPVKTIAFNNEMSRSELIVDPLAGPLKDIIENSGSVPRGQSFYYGAPESQRMGSFEAWRPRGRVGRPNFAICSRSRDDKSEIFVAMQTSSSTLWQNVPVQLLTTFQKNCDFAIFSSAADSLAGVEIYDAIQHIHPDALQMHPDFDAYRIAKTIRNRHVTVNADKLVIPGAEKLKKYVLLPMLYQVYRDNPQHDWYIIVEDSTSLLMKNMRRFLAELDPKKKLYLGSAVSGPSLDFADSGSTIVLSNALMKEVFDIKTEPHNIFNDQYIAKVASEGRGDHALASFIYDRTGVKLDKAKSKDFFHQSSLFDIKLTVDNWCDPLGSFGNQQPRGMELLADYLDLKRGQQILHSDIYLDFFKPYLTSTQQNWDNGARDIEFGPQHDDSTNAHESLAGCREACSKTDKCVMFRYDSYHQYCGLGVASIALGSPILQYNNAPDDEACEQFGICCKPRTRSQITSSEWFVDRIRSMRKSIVCDPLYHDEGSEGSEYGALDQVEGWWHRVEQDSHTLESTL